MPFQFFNLPLGQAHALGNQTARLNQFLASHTVFSVEKSLVVTGEMQSWVFCVEYEGGAAAPSQATVGAAKGEFRNKIDYREILSPPDFALFDRLRAWRRDQAATENVVLYTVIGNSPLAEIATKRPDSLAGLEKIPGVGVAKRAKYGNELLELVQASFPPSAPNAALEAVAGPDPTF